MRRVTHSGFLDHLPAAAATASAATATTAVTTSASATTAIATATASAAKPTRLARLGLVDDELASLHVKAVECFDGPEAFVVVGHLDEAEAPRASRLTVDDDRGAADLA